MGAGRGRRTGMILILVVIIVLVIGVFAVWYLSRQVTTAVTDGGDGQAVRATATPLPAVRNLIVAARDIPRGAQLTVQDVTVLAWPDSPEAPPPPNALFVGVGVDAAGLEQVEGRIARVDILSGQPVLDHLLTPGDQPAGLGDVGSDAALLIPSGQVAVAVPITRFSSVAYALRPGDHVDIMASLRFVDVNLDTQTVLPNIGVMVTDDPLLGALLFYEFEYGQIDDAAGPFGTTLLIVPNPDDQRITNDDRPGGQRPRQTTQLIVDNAIVLHVGDWPIKDIYEPIVVMAEPPKPAAQAADQPDQPDQPVATPTPIPLPPEPDIITLVMSRQDALVLKYVIEVGGRVDLALRSALDDDINDITTTSVTLQYIIESYNVDEPPRLPFTHDPRIDLLVEYNGLWYWPDYLPPEATVEAP